MVVQPHYKPVFRRVNASGKILAPGPGMKARHRAGGGLEAGSAGAELLAKEQAL